MPPLFPRCISLPKRALLKWVVATFAMSILVGCSGLNPSQSTPDSSQPKEETNPITSNNANSTETPVTPSQPSPDVPTDSSKTFLANMMQLAREGKVINCEFPAKTTVIDDIKKKWGEPKSSDYIAAAKGTYATYPNHNLAFGFNKGAQIFEVRSFDPQLKKISLSKVKAVFGTPAYTTQTKSEEIIGYTAGKEFKLLLVFPRASNTNPDPSLDHYSILYPQGTVNNMANDSGRQW